MQVIDIAQGLIIATSNRYIARHRRSSDAFPHVADLVAGILGRDSTQGSEHAAAPAPRAACRGPSGKEPGTQKRPPPKWKPFQLMCARRDSNP